jgi:prepilin peptidase CpaA
MLIDKEIVYPATASVAALLGAAFDVRSRRIPNFVTAPAFLAGLLLHLGIDGWRGLAASLAAGSLCGALFLIFYLAGGMGAGDVKLVAAAAALAGLPNVTALLIFTSLAGGAMGILLALVRGRFKATLFNVTVLTSHHQHLGLTPHPELNVRNGNTLRLPYGLAIAAGCCVTLYLQGVQG